jgi:hypothetical protein
MNPLTPVPPPAAPTLAAALGRVRVQVQLFGPMALWVAVRWWLEFELDTTGRVLPQPLSAATDPQAMMLWVTLALAALLALGGLVWWLMRAPAGAARDRVLRGLLWTWIGLWLLGSAMAVRSHFNRIDLPLLQSPPSAHAFAVVGQQAHAASTHGLGGVTLYLDGSAPAGLHTLFVEDPAAQTLHDASQVELQLTPGRWNGLFVTGLRVLARRDPAADRAAAAAEPAASNADAAATGPTRSTP